MTGERTDRETNWESADRARRYLDEVRAGIPYGEAQLDVMTRVLRELGRPIDRFLDLGCGAGAVASTVLEAFPGAEAVLVDFNDVMLEEVIRAFPQPPHHVVRADFGDPAWRDRMYVLAPFDAIVSGYAIHHAPDRRKQALYSEIFQLLNEGGMFVNIEHVRPASDDLANIYTNLYFDWLAAFHERIGTDKRREDIIREFDGRKGHGHNVLAPLVDQCDWLRAIGFEHVDSFFQIFEMAVFGGKKPSN